MAQLFQSLESDELARLLIDGGVGVIPTDTVYGLVCCAADADAVDRLFLCKQREGKRGTVIAANIDQLVVLGVKARYLKAVEQFWPGGVSVEIQLGEALSYLHLGMRSNAFRIPGHPKLQMLLERTGPLLTTSANLPGKPTAKTIQEAQDVFGNSVDFFVEGGDLGGALPSTLVRIIDDEIEVIRQGAVKI